MVLATGRGLYSQHADAAVLELGLTQPLDVQKIGEVERVETGLRTRQAARLARRSLEEGHRVHRLRDRHRNARGARGLPSDT